MRLRFARDLALLGTFLGCGTSGDLDGQERPRVPVEVRLLHLGEPQAAPGARVFETNRGYRIKVTRGFVGVWAVHLAGCDEPLSRRILKWLSPVRTAYAHGSSAGKVLIFLQKAVSLTDLSSGEVAAVRGDRPAGTYCRLRVHIGALDVPPTRSNLRGYALVVEGSYAPIQIAPCDPSLGLEAQGCRFGNERPLLLGLFNLRENEKYLTAEKALDPPLELSSDQSVRVRVSLGSDAWFDDLDPGDLGSRESREILARHIIESVELTLEASPAR